MKDPLDTQIDTVKKQIEKQQKIVNDNLFEDDYKAETAYKKIEKLRFKLEKLFLRKDLEEA